MRDRLRHAVFRNDEIFARQIADNSRGLFLQHERIDGDEIDVSLDCYGFDFRLSAAWSNGALSRLRHHQRWQLKESEQEKESPGRDTSVHKHLLMAGRRQVLYVRGECSC